MSDCSHLKADWKKLENMAEIFSSPQTFAYHVGKDLMVNGNDIFSEIEDAVAQYGKQNWLQFGVDIGEASAKLILGQPALTIPLFENQGLADALNGDQVTWSQCSSSADVWTLDADDSSYSPDPFSGGDSLTFDMKGSVSSAITVQGVHVKV